MQWDNRLFDEAFDRAGLREQVEPVVGGVPDTPFQARFDRPQEIMLDEQIHTTDYSIEYAHHECPSLDAGDAVVIGGVAYNVIQPPRRQGDGYYAVAQLELSE